MSVFDQDEELKALEAESKQQRVAKGLMGALGSALDNFQSIPSAYQMLSKRGGGMSSSSPTASKALAQVSSLMEDPMERKQKAYAYLKDKMGLERGQKDAEFADYSRERQKKSDSEADALSLAAKDPASPRNIAARAFYKKQGFEVGDADTESDLAGRYGAAADLTKMSLEEKRRINEESRRQAAEREREKARLDMELAKSGATQAFELEKQGRGFAHDKEMVGLRGEQDLKLKALAEANSKGKRGDDDLALEDKEVIKSLAQTNANRIAISNSIDAAIASWKNMNESQRLQSMKQLIKTLNSDQGKDAVGAEEAKRLASKLEFAFGNFTNDNPTQFGRDLEGFESDAVNTSKNIKQSIKMNEQEIARRRGGKMNPTADNGGDEYVIMISPKDKKQKRVRKSDVPAAIAAGGIMVDGPMVGSK